MSKIVEKKSLEQALVLAQKHAPNVDWALRVDYEDIKAETFTTCEGEHKGYYIFRDYNNNKYIIVEVSSWKKDGVKYEADKEAHLIDFLKKINSEVVI